MSEAEARPGPAEAPRAVECHGLRYRFGAQAAVDGIDVDVGTGEIFGLLGPNGAGKTTTIRILTTLLPVQEGTAAIFGVDVARHPIQVRRLVGYVPQQLSADATLTGRENVGLFARLFDVPRRERKERVDEALAMMGVDGAADRLVSTYSGGMTAQPPGVLKVHLFQERFPITRQILVTGSVSAVEDIGVAANESLVAFFHISEARHIAIAAHQSFGRMSMASLGNDASLEDVFRHFAGRSLADDEGGESFREVRSTRRTAGRMG